MTIETYDDLKQYVGSKNDFTDDLLNMGYTKGYNKALDDTVDIYNSNPDISVYNLIRQLEMQKGTENE